MEFQVGSNWKNDPSSDLAKIGPITLSIEWKEYEIDLKDKDMSYLNAGFYWVATAKDNPNGFTFYLDDIRFEK